MPPSFLHPSCRLRRLSAGVFCLATPLFVVNKVVRTRQFWTANFVPGCYYAARCRPPTDDSVTHVVIANAPDAQFTVILCDNEVRVAQPGEYVGNLRPLATARRSRIDII